MAGLSGAKEIAQHAGVYESTLMKWVRSEDFPATKIGGTWVSDTHLINKWRNRRIAKQCEAANAGRW